MTLRTLLITFLLALPVTVSSAPTVVADTTAFETRPHEYRPDPSSLQLPPHYPDTPAVREDLANYYGVLHRMDQEFASALQVLEDRGLGEDTLVIFMGDNGAALLRGKGTLYEASCHVPLIAQWPGKTTPGTVCDELVSGEDIAATVLEAAGLEPLEKVFCTFDLNGRYVSAGYFEML